MTIDYAEDLRRTVVDVSASLASVSDDVVSRRPAAGKWSAKEVLGHLIDSAANNHQRFVRGQFQEDLVFPGYEQDAWVAAQGYQAAPWRHLLELWREYNLHIARVIEVMPEDARLRTRTRHNLHERAWRAVPEHESTTLDYFMRDYVGHLHHHVRQIAELIG